MLKSLKLVKKSEDGGIALEAAVVLPFFLVFVLAMACMIKLTVTDLALQRAVTETIKPLAAYAYPVQLLASEAQEAYEGSKVGEAVDAVLSRVTSARARLLQGEQFADQYEVFIPDFMLHLIEWEQQKRELAENYGREQADSFMDNQIDPLIRSAFHLLVLQAADPQVISGERLKIVEVRLPKLGSTEEAVIGVAAEYEVKLPIPFYRKTITLRKQAYERLWIGS